MDVSHVIDMGREALPQVALLLSGASCSRYGGWFDRELPAGS